MKKTTIFLIFLMVFMLSSYSLAFNNVIEKINIGMKLADFFKLIPKDNLKAHGNQYTYKEKIGNLDGEWCFDVKEKKIDWFQYSYYPPDYKNKTDKKTYNFLLKETESIIKGITGIYGKPKSISETRPYVDPYKKFPVYSHEVKSALWITGGKGIKAQFYFFGGKGEYWMSVQIHCNRKDYKY